MANTKRECISFSKDFEEEYDFFIRESKGNKSYYICMLLRKEKNSLKEENEHGKQSK